MTVYLNTPIPAYLYMGFRVELTRTHLSLEELTKLTREHKELQECFGTNFYLSELRYN
jgi:hypothetical protein